MGGWKGHEGRGESMGCQTDSRNGVSESGQPDYRNSCGGRCRVRTGESWCSDRRDLAAGREEPVCGRND